ncbi:MAG: hypothetical protein RI992_458, partial [Actinomycetota bacterium]
MKSKIQTTKFLKQLLIGILTIAVTSLGFQSATAASTVNIAAVSGVTPPITGATPVTTGTSSADFDVTSISWSGSPVTFAASTVYTAT